ncbi:hypothetical protein FRB90_000592 [Tulasnella sp. 427]|nr:hypothetical protein FRB90_000592 [Tulasnella sp. 427]
MFCTMQGSSCSPAHVGQKIAGVDIARIASRVQFSIFQVPTSAAPAVDAPDALTKPLKSFEFNASELGSFRGLKTGDHESTSLGSWRDAAKNVIFCDTYGLPCPDMCDSTQQDPALRPDLEDSTFLVTCSINRRLAPLSYDRKIFHLEFDTAETRVKNAIWEALGVHGWNDTDEFPPRSSKSTSSVARRSRSTVHSPSKSKDHQLALRFIGATEGSAASKKVSEVNTVVRRRFEDPRHYSIVSSQAALGDRVDLALSIQSIISGSPRFGQCTCYLAALKPSQQVTVLGEYVGFTRENAMEYIAELKEEECYVLELY